MGPAIAVGQQSITGNQAVLGYWNGYDCNCDLADVQLHEAALTPEQIMAAYERFEVAKLCPP